MKKKLLLSFIVSALSICSVVQAAGVESAKYNVQTGTLQVTGTVESGSNSPLQIATLRIFKPGKTAENISGLSDEEKKSAIAFIKQAEIGTDSSFSFTYTPENFENGNHKIYVTSPGGEIYSEYVLFLSSDKNSELIDDLNAADTKEKMKAVLEKHEYLLSGIETIDEISNKFPDEDIIGSIAGMIAGKKFSDADGAVKASAAAAVVTNINLAETADDIVAVLENYSSEIGFSENKIYTELFLSFAGTESEKFLNKDYKNTDLFVTDFCDTIIVDKLNGTNNYTGVMSILDAGRNYLNGFKFEKYDGLSDSQKAYVQKKVVDYGSYSKVLEIKNVFNTAVDNAPSENSSQGGSSSGGGSGGGSSSGDSGGKMGVSKVTQTESENKEIFDDLSSAEWAKESILSLYEKGIVSGMGDKKFEPAGLVTREQFAKMIVSACGLHNKNAVCGFNDTENGMWYYSYVASAAQEGIVYGISEDMFGIGNNITREDMAVMVFRAAEKSGVVNGAVTESIFSDDADISEYAKTAVYTLRGNNVMSGKGDNKFEPKAFATRAEAAKMIYNLICLGGKA